MGDFSKKISTFLDVFVNQNGYAKVLEGLQNTLLIAVLGLVIGIVIGTIIAIVRVRQSAVCFVNPPEPSHNRSG